MSNDNKDHLNNLRHSTAHLLAAAVMDLYPDAKRAIGPAIENGFYFDFDFGKTKISEEDFPRIEAKMREILPSWGSFERHELTKEEAEKEYIGNPYKLELIEEFTKDGEKVSFYKSGNYWDLCKGGHSPHPKNDLKHFKLLSVAGAYWRGSEKNPMLTRIYGTAFPSKTALDNYLTMIEEARKRDHKKLGKELDLFFFTETAPGMAYWLPHGLTIYNTLYSFARSMYTKFGYHEVATPQLNKKELYETSGHWTHYRDDMFISPMSYLREDSQKPLEGSEVFGVKPMNCPNAMTIFASKTRSYNDMPLRWAETSMLHRFELSGTLNGLFRTRMFRQDDAHIFIRLSQIKDEFKDLMQMTQEMYEPFGLSYRLRFGTRPEKFMGEASDWDHAENELRTVLQESGKEYIEVAGEGAFYGPKVDILMKDSLGREWQTGTIQLDFQQPKRFSLKYTENDGSEKNTGSFP
jgi:threonyl-tRNA synthetase